MNINLKAGLITLLVLGILAGFIFLVKTFPYVMLWILLISSIGCILSALFLFIKELIKD